MEAPSARQVGLALISLPAGRPTSVNDKHWQEALGPLPPPPPPPLLLLARAAELCARAAPSALFANQAQVQVKARLRVRLRAN